MAKGKKAKQDPRLETKAGRLAYAGFILRTGGRLPGETVTAAPAPNRHPPEVESSILRLLRDIGSNNAGAFLARWTPEEIIEDLTAVIVAVTEDYYNCIKNPAGMLWDNLEARFPKGRGR